MILGHGGNKNALANRIGCPVEDIVDMSCNLNPLGPPNGLEAFLSRNMKKIRSLPQPDAADMVHAFARYHAVDPKRVLAGNGTTWFIYTLPLALKAQKVLIIGPTYSDYSDGCAMHNVSYAYSMTNVESEFKPDIARISELLSDRQAGFDTVILCNPNNPTGTLVETTVILDLLQAHKDVTFVIDESYLPFVRNAQTISLVAENRFPNLIVLSSMSKIFRMPGLRTGFLCADPRVIEAFKTFYQPWSVNALAQAAVVHLLENEKNEIQSFMEKTWDFIEKEKTIFQDSLKGLPGFRLFSSHTYFILARILGDVRSDEFCTAIGNERLLIRDCANFQGLSDQFVRFSLKGRKINMTLSRLIKNLITQGCVPHP
jgi:threonine-phosphate decarboxylase